MTLTAQQVTTARSQPGTEPDRRTPAWGRRSSDKGWPPGGAALGCRIIELPRITDPRGNLTFIEGQRHVPFDIARVVNLYDVPGGETRGGHAHRELQQVIIAVAGSFDVVVDDGTHRERFSLNRSYYGLYVPPMIWREMEDFSSGSVSLVLASHAYDEADYYRDYDEFVRAAHDRRAGS
jgi:dTDP-4-dehydrorhamnose 3,5-epimerase-like enzyme